MAARTPCLRRCSTINTTSPSQQGVEGTNSRRGLDTHRRISDTGHVYLLVRKNLSSSLQRRHIYARSLQATSRCALRGLGGLVVVANIVGNGLLKLIKTGEMVGLQEFPLQ